MKYGITAALGILVIAAPANACITAMHQRIVDVRSEAPSDYTHGMIVARIDFSEADNALLRSGGQVLPVIEMVDGPNVGRLRIKLAAVGTSCDPDGQFLPTREGQSGYLILSQTRLDDGTFVYTPMSTTRQDVWERTGDLS